MSEELIRRSDIIKVVAEYISCDYATEKEATESATLLIDTVPIIKLEHGEWVLDPNGMDWNIPAWRCSRCGFVANYIGVEANGLGRNPMNWAGSKYCPNCGADMRNKDDE